MALSLGNLATVLMRQHQRTQALPLFERAREIYLAMNYANVALEEATYPWSVAPACMEPPDLCRLLAALAREPGSPLPVPAFRAFVVAEQARLGAVQMALARAGARAVTGEASAATLAWQVEELRRRQRALWRQLSEADTTSGAAVIPPTGPSCSLPYGRWTVSWPGHHPPTRGLSPLRRAHRPGPHRHPGGASLATPGRSVDRWFTLADRVLIWLVRPGQEAIYRDVPVAKADLTAMVSRVRRDLDHGPWEPFEVAQAHALYTLLLAP